VAVINARLSPRSFRRYRKLSWLARRVLATIDLIAVQTEEYADHFRKLGVAANHIRVTGSVKYDGVETNRANPRTQELARLFGLSSRHTPCAVLETTPHEDDGTRSVPTTSHLLTTHHSPPLIWVAGSTQDPEEKIILDIYTRLQKGFPHLRLFLVPRQRERFEEVARLLQRSGLAFIRRSQLLPPSPALPLSPSPSVILVDTIGELGALWGLADIAFVGGSLDGRRGGQNMIEPAAYGAAVIFGPHVWNFQDTAARLENAGAAIRVADAVSLETTTRRLLTDRAERKRFGERAREFVVGQQGGTNRTIESLDQLLVKGYHHNQAA
jgi:3-deoxy-D-manno-octulosonic-acid transferase